MWVEDYFAWLYKYDIPDGLNFLKVLWSVKDVNLSLISIPNIEYSNLLDLADKSERCRYKIWDSSDNWKLALFLSWKAFYSYHKSVLDTISKSCEDAMQQVSQQ